MNRDLAYCNFEFQHNSHSKDKYKSKWGPNSKNLFRIHGAKPMIFSDRIGLALVQSLSHMYVYFVYVDKNFVINKYFLISQNISADLKGTKEKYKICLNI